MRRLGCSLLTEIAEHEHHTEPLAAQTRHEHLASQNKQNFASANHGRPAIAATAKAGVFSGKGVVAAKSAGAPYKAPAMSPKQARSSTPAATHASTLWQAFPPITSRPVTSFLTSQ